MTHDRISLGRAVILVCPCCATPQDAEPTGQRERFECLSCEQIWFMEVDLDRFAEFALT